MKSISISRALVCLLLSALIALACLPAMAQGQVNKITLPKKQTVYVGRAITLTPAVSPQGAAVTLTWSSAREAVATVQDGVVTGVKPGKARITVTAGGKKASCMVTVAPVPVESFDLDARETSGRELYQQGRAVLLTGHQVQLSPANIQPAGATPGFAYKSSRPAAASVSKAGLVTGKKAGSTQITVASQHGRAARQLPLEVIANQMEISAERFMQTIESYHLEPTPGAGIVPIAKKVYLKKGDLMVDMFMYNADSVALGGKQRMAVFLIEKAAGAALTDYMFAGNYTLSMKKTRPGRFSVSTVNLGPVKDILDADQTQVVLLDAMALGQAPMEAKQVSANSLAAQLAADLTR